jgi:hypothetical protein
MGGDSGTKSDAETAAVIQRAKVHHGAAAGVSEPDGPDQYRVAGFLAIQLNNRPVQLGYEKPILPQS